MEQIKNFGDKRQVSYCVYCGGGVETREHAPARVFLDEPYPEDIPTVRACDECNQSYSLDEEYVACLIECAKVGNMNLDLLQREKVRHILKQKPSLADRIQQAMQVNKEGVSFTIETDRFKKVLLKLARCHILFEQNEPQRGEPDRFEFGTLDILTQKSREIFENAPQIDKVPEVGSRAMQRILIFGEFAQTPWVEVQGNRYRYLTVENGVVRIVLSEYVWCEVAWGA